MLYVAHFSDHSRGVSSWVDDGSVEEQFCRAVHRLVRYFLVSHFLLSEVGAEADSAYRISSLGVEILEPRITLIIARWAISSFPRVVLDVFLYARSP